jgi:hypothetical protein
MPIVERVDVWKEKSKAINEKRVKKQSRVVVIVVKAISIEAEKNLN